MRTIRTCTLFCKKHRRCNKKTNDPVGGHSSFVHGTVSFSSLVVLPFIRRRGCSIPFAYLLNDDITYFSCINPHGFLDLLLLHFPSLQCCLRFEQLRSGAQ